MNHLRSQWRAAIQRQAVAARNGIHVQVRYIGKGNSWGGTEWEGTVLSGTGYRAFGSWGELKDSIRGGTWRSRGTFVIEGEGETQFASSLETVLNWRSPGSGPSGNIGIIEADLSGCRFQTFIQKVSYEPEDAGGFKQWQGRGEKRGGYLWLPREGATEGIIYPDTGLGIGIDGGVPLNQIHTIYEIENKQIVRSWPFREWESHVDRLKDKGDWIPETPNNPDSTRSWVGWVEYDEGPAIYVLPKSRPFFHRLNDNQDRGDCGFDIYRETDKARDRIFGKNSWGEDKFKKVRDGKSRVPEQWIKDAGRTGILRIEGYRDRTQIKAKPCPECWPRYR